MGGGLGEFQISVKFLPTTFHEKGFFGNVDT